MSESTPTVFTVPARVDSNSSASFERDVMAVITAGSKALILDFSGVGYISSAGLRVVLLGAKKMKAASGRYVLCGLSPSVADVFRVSGFSKILDIVADLPTAQSKLV